MRFLAKFCAALATLALAAQPVLAQSVLRDAETEALMNDMAAPLVEASGLEEGNVDMVLINDPSINAFVAGGQVVYLHSGLIDAADTANEVQGVIAHELGHVTGGHVIRSADSYRSATNITLLSLLLGAAAVAAGSGEAGMAAILAGQRAALGKFLSFNRAQEASADAAGAEYLSKAGISGRGSLDFFGKLLNQEFRYGRSQGDEAEFIRTHPLSGDRIRDLQSVYETDAAWDTPNDPAMEQRFQRVKAKLVGYLEEPKRVLRSYPRTRTDIPARYARAWAYHRDAQIARALEESEALIAAEPDNPYFLELKGQILLESGRPEDAILALRKANTITNNHPLIASMFGHALIATEDPAYHDEAEQVLRAAVVRDRWMPFAWRNLGVVYAERGDMPRARLASAEQQVMQRDYFAAIRSAQIAEAGLPENTPDWYRAQDIRLQAQALLEAQDKRR